MFSGNIDLTSTLKKKFTINNDPDCVVELNTSDMSMLARLSETSEKLDNLKNEACEALGKDDGKDTEIMLKSTATILTRVDTELRNAIDYIFDSDVSSKVAPNGSMYDMFEGQFRYEIIISAIVSLYEENITAEYAKMESRVNAHAEKYIKK